MWTIGGMILDDGKPKYLEKNLSYCSFVHLKSHMEWAGIGVGSPL
jgi:hypothetical protein